MIKKLINRVQRLEEKSCDTITRRDARTMIHDKVEPLQKQMASIDAKLDRIIEIMIKDR